jgi:hypothetical protein
LSKPHDMEAGLVQPTATGPGLKRPEIAHPGAKTACAGIRW